MEIKAWAESGREEGVQGNETDGGKTPTHTRTVVAFKISNIFG
jgi:hypothetical protein